MGDADVIKCLKMLTFVPLEEIGELEKADNINAVKERLAFEVTKMVHGAEEAEKALNAARALFSGAGNTENMPSTQLSQADLTDGAVTVIDLLVAAKLAPSKGEARRLIQQGGIAVDDQKVTDIAAVVTAADFEKGHVTLKKGKKVFHKITLE